MMEALFQMNWFAIAAASVANFCLGGIWFVALFGKQYASSLGIADRPAQKPGPLFIIGPFICGTINIVTTAFLLQALQIHTYGGALALGVIVGIGYLVAMTVNIAINPLFPRPFYYALINSPMFLMGSLMSCVILVAMS
ncbi:DUF1761 domain-containing protein [Duganella sp. Dugasp56]|uniref:DUF1761 domain-containing protein n=1 Tax=Duganella sp. Dugasp56 TaxID=3243046 RepID=UPI0039AF186A